MQRIDLVGQRFGRLVVRAYAGARVTGGNIYWRCKCDCGKQATIRVDRLKYGTTQSCGCFQREVATKRAKTGDARRRHGHAGGSVAGVQSRAYRVWHMMIQRCTNPNRQDYDRYGGRGITVCDRWRNDFVAFLADMGEPPDGLTLDRKNNDKGYYKRNCRWATDVQQRANKRPRLIRPR